MQPALGAYLAKGGCLLMLNPGKERLPEHLGDVGATFIDREGTGLSLHDAQSAVQAARNRKLAAIIRTDGLSVDEIAACAELGPDGVVLPQVVQVQELAQAVDVLRPYSLCVIAQIETVEAVEALFELMDIDGVDAFLIGPNDLSEAMGFPGEPDHEVVRRTVEAVAADLASAERVFGLPTTSAEARQYWSGRGAQLHYAPLKAFLQMEKTTCP